MTLYHKKTLQGVILLIIALIFLFAFFWRKFHQQTDFTLDQLIEIKGTLSNVPIIRQTSAKGGDAIDITLGEFPAIIFSNSGTFLDPIDQKSILAIPKQGDSIKLFISRNDYHQRIKKDKELKQIDKIMKGESVEMFVITINHTQYLTLSDLNKTLAKEEPIKTFFIMLGLILSFTASIYSFSQNKLNSPT